MRTTLGDGQQIVELATASPQPLLPSQTITHISDGANVGGPEAIADAVVETGLRRVVRSVRQGEAVGQARRGGGALPSPLSGRGALAGAAEDGLSDW